MAERRLTVYTRAGCHLCDEMIEALGRVPGIGGFRFEVIDVDTRPELLRRYGDRVPVLAHGERELCEGRLDPAVVATYLATVP